MDSITIAGSNADYMVIWAFFTLFVGIALAIDLGIIGKILHILTVKSRSRNHDNNTSQKRKISSALPVGPKSDQQQQLFVIGDAALVLDSKGKALPTNAYFAEHHGRIAAQNIYALLNGEKKLLEYRPEEAGSTFAISMGKDLAVSRVGGLDLFGYSASKLELIKFFFSIEGIL